MDSRTEVTMNLRIDRLILSLERLTNTAIRQTIEAESTPPNAPPRRTRRKKAARGAHLYLVEFVGHSVKVGVSTNPLDRLATHADEGRRFGFEVGRAWVTPAHFEALDNEAEIKGASPTEYLRRDFDDVLEQALALTMTPVEVARG